MVCHDAFYLIAMPRRSGDRTGLFDRARRAEGLDLEFGESSCVSDVVVESGECESGLELTVYVLLKGVGKLHAAVGFPELLHLLGIFERIEGKMIYDHTLVIVDYVIYHKVESGEKNPALF